MIHLKIKLVTKTLLLFIFSILFCQNLKVFSQNISFEELVSLQKNHKSKIAEFLIKKRWKQDAKLDYIWFFEKKDMSDSTEAMIVLRTEYCNKNILYYYTSDSLNYNELKSCTLKSSQKDSIINFPDICIKDFTLKNLYVRFYETHKTNQIPLYALWIFSKEDGWFFDDIDKVCFPKNNTKKKDLQIQADIVNTDPILTVVEKAPEFQGGDEGRFEYLRYNTNYPVEAREHGIQGTVFVTFVIEIDGSITNIKILKGIGGGCNEEVIRLIKNMPRWTPGTQNGKPVRVQFNMPLKFTLSDG